MPPARIARRGSGALHAEGRYVLYWMTAHRRLEWNFALDRAVELATELEKPLLVFEPLRLDYRWACTRFHQFVIDGMREHAAACRSIGIHYLPFVEREPDQGRGLLGHLAKRAAAVVGDDYPAFFLPGMVRAAARVVDCHFEVIDSNGLLPMQDAGRAFTSAYAFRRHLQRTLPNHLGWRPHARIRLERRPGEDVLGQLPERWEAGRGWPSPLELATLALDSSVGPTKEGGSGGTGGAVSARALLEDFASRVGAYPEDRRHPDRNGASRLSAHLHWGHISAHEVVHTLLDAEGWTPLRLGDRPDGKRSGWWGTSSGLEAFLDQVVTWRELGFNTCAFNPDYEEYESLPAWALQTLEEHAGDPRPYVYPLETLESAATHDPLWNAAQTQLRREGRLHNYLRMLWGKKILEWTDTPRQALAVMIELNNKYGLDGRDPNSYAGISWTLGRYDRGWPERAVYGRVRCMTSASTRKKVEVESYIARFS